MKVYISGPMTGIKDFNRPNFEIAEKELSAHGFAVYNPGRLILPEEFNSEDLMKIDLAALSCCDAIYLLHGWSNSKGCNIECWQAEKIGMKYIERIVEDSGLISFAIYRNFKISNVHFV